jgi:DnaJ-domain-containing protein 1
MADIYKRLSKIGRASFLSKTRRFNEWLKRKPGKPQFSSFQDIPEHDIGDASQNQNTPGDNPYESGRGRGYQPNTGMPQQVIDDLAVFGLTPPASMAEVRQARNREMKKYHSDKFIHDNEKFETSKEIMQIYNAAYTRLKDYYS